MENQVRLRLKDAVRRIAEAIESRSHVEIRLHGALFRIVLRMPQKIIKISAEMEIPGQEKAIEESVEINIKDVSTINIDSYRGMAMLFLGFRQLMYSVAVTHGIYVYAREYNKHLSIAVDQI